MDSGDNNDAVIAGEVSACSMELGTPALVLQEPPTEHFVKEMKEEKKGTGQWGQQWAGGGTEFGVDVGVLVNMKREALEEEGMSTATTSEEASSLCSPEKKSCAPAGSDLVHLHALDKCVLRLRPKIARHVKKRVPEEEKDAAYFAKREKNVLAARRCRRKKREIDELRVNLIKSLLVEVQQLRAVGAEVEKAENELQQAEEDLARWKQLVDALVLGGGKLRSQPERKP